MKNATSIVKLQRHHNVPDLEVSFARRYIKDNGYEAPVLVVNRQRLIQAVTSFREAMPRVEPHFAIKANPDPSILRVLAATNCGFEFASKAELELLLNLGIDPSKTYFSNPIKSPGHLSFAAEQGVIWHVVDSVEELEKVKLINPRAKIYLRLKISNQGALWPLYGKFGASESEIDRLLKCARELGASINGLTFHVGSQCVDARAWRNGIDFALKIAHKLTLNNMSFELLNLGGGFPIAIAGDEPTIFDIAEQTNRLINSLPNTVKVIAEPGRYLVATAGCLVSEVAGIVKRNSENWLYLDTGIYNGLSEHVENFLYSLKIPEADGPNIEWTVAGPTCDSVDVLKNKHWLPANIRPRAQVFIPNSGAYTNAAACRFNGFEIPRVEVI